MAANDVTPLAEPSTAQPNLTGNLTPAMKAAWNKGAEPKPQDAAPVDPPKVETPEGEKPESAADAGAADRQEKGKKGKLSADERIAQLESTIEKIRKSSGKAETHKAESSPAKVEVLKPEPLKKPKLADYGNQTEGYDLEKYTDDLEVYSERLIEQKAAEALQKREAEKAQTEQEKGVRQKFDEAKQRYGDEEFESSVKPLIESIVTDQSIAMQLKSVIGASPVMADVLFTIGSDPEAMQDFLATARADPIAAMRKFLITEGLVMDELDKQKAGKDKKPEVVKAKPDVEEETPVSTPTRVPKPVSEVGGRGTAPEDAAQSAVRAGGGNRLTPQVKAEWNRRALGK